jgi:MinD-like ATPase involved in chromosome partitioning or flagellar assembly
MKYSTPSNQSNKTEHCNKTQPYMRYGVIMAESINNDLIVMTCDDIQVYSDSYSFVGIVIKSDIPNYTPGQKYTFYNNYFNVVDCEMILNTIEERKSGWSINDYKNKTRVRVRTIGDIRDDKLTKIGI